MSQHTLTNAKLQAMHAALAQLGNRRMALITGDLKVSRLLKAITPIVEGLPAAKQRITSEALEGKDLQNLKQPEITAINAEIAAKQRALDEETVEIELPNIRLTEDDLPKEQKGEEGWKNASQLGAIVADLDFLFEFKPE